jgi:malate dehydrogenase
MFFGVPVVLGRAGMQRIIEYKLDPEEQALFDKSASAVRETHEALKKLVKI